MLWYGCIGYYCIWFIDGFEDELVICVGEI